MSTFDDYRVPKTRGGGGACSLCGAPSKGRVALAMQERRPGKSSATTYPAIDSTSHTYCEPCAIQVYEACKAAMMSEHGQQ